MEWKLKRFNLKTNITIVGNNLFLASEVDWIIILNKIIVHAI